MCQQLVSNRLQGLLNPYRSWPPLLFICLSCRASVKGQILFGSDRLLHGLFVHNVLLWSFYACTKSVSITASIKKDNTDLVSRFICLNSERQSQPLKHSFFLLLFSKRLLKVKGLVFWQQCWFHTKNDKKVRKKVISDQSSLFMVRLFWREKFYLDDNRHSQL